MDKFDCSTCGREMLLNGAGAQGDPAFVCVVDDAAHRAAAAARKLECEQLLRAAKEAPPGPSPEQLAEIGAWSRPDPVEVDKP